MKVLSLHQPWATLVALGVKMIETRSWSTKYRGPLAIHAAATMPPYSKRYVKGVSLAHEYEHVGGQWWMSLHGIKVPASAPPPVYGAPLGDYRVPLGAIVATCRLVDVVPMVEDIPPQSEWREPWSVLTLEPWPILYHWRGFGSANGCYKGDQLPYGDFAYGRFGWLLADIKPLDEPVPFKGGQGLTKTWEPT